MLYVFSTLFLLGVLISLFWGIYIIRLNPKSDINRLFALILLPVLLLIYDFKLSYSLEMERAIKR